MITALINNRAVSLIGLLDNRAVNLIDLEHSIQYFSLLMADPRPSYFKLSKASQLLILKIAKTALSDNFKP